MTGARRRGGDDVHELVIVDLTGRVAQAGFPDDGARSGTLALPPAIEHGAAGEHDGGNVDGRGCHKTCWRGLIATGREHDAVERVAVQHLHQREVGQVAVERGGWALSGFLDGVHRKLEADTTRVPNTLFDALGEIEVMPITGSEVVPSLGDADDRAPGLQLFAGQAVVEVAFKVERRHARVVRIVEPELASKVAGFALAVAHHASVPVYEPNPALQLAKEELERPLTGGRSRQRRCPSDRARRADTACRYPAVRVRFGHDRHAMIDKL